MNYSDFNELQTDNRTGEVFGDLTIMGWSHKDGKNNKYHVVKCSTCEQDTELFGDGVFAITYDNLKRGAKPCGCGKTHKYNEYQNIIRIKRKCVEYGYTFVGWDGEYNSTKTKLTLSCSKHGVFNTTNISEFLFKGAGCRGCKSDKLKQGRLQKEEFLKRIHNKCNEYGSTFVSIDGKYIGVSTNIVIKCVHGEYVVDGKTFIHQSCGCKQCCAINHSLAQATTFADFEPSIIAKCKKYNQVLNGVVGVYKDTRSEISLTCLTHNLTYTYKITNAIHGNSSMCPCCIKQNRSKISTQPIDHYVSKLNLPDHCSYVGVAESYKGGKTKITINCDIHGHQHNKTFVDLIWHKCKPCDCCESAKSIGGYKPTSSGWFYVVEWSNGSDSFVKFGITNHSDASVRIKQQSKETLYTPTIIESVHFEDGKYPVLLEKFIKENYKTGVVDKAVFGDGFTETIHYDELAMMVIRNQMRHYKKQDILQQAA